MNSIKNQHKMDLYFHLIFLGFFLILWWKLIPMFSDLVSTYSFYRGEKKQLQHQLELIRKRDLIKKKLSNMEKKLAGNLKTDTCENTISSLIGRIQDSSAQYRIRIVELKPGSYEKTDFYTIVPISLQFNGSFLAGMSFIRELESNPTLLKIIAIDITSENPFQKPILNFEMSMKVFLN